jgi:hypothetical protein
MDVINLLVNCTLDLIESSQNPVVREDLFDKRLRWIRAYSSDSEKSQDVWIHIVVAVQVEHVSAISSAHVEKCTQADAPRPHVEPRGVADTAPTCVDEIFEPKKVVDAQQNSIETLWVVFQNATHTQIPAVKQGVDHHQYIYEVGFGSKHAPVLSNCLISARGFAHIASLLENKFVQLAQQTPGTLPHRRQHYMYGFVRVRLLPNNIQAPIQAA